MRKTKEGITRTSFDFATDAVQTADAITEAANFSSRKETFERSIRFYGQAFRAREQGLRVVTIDAEGKIVDVGLDLPFVQPRIPERLIMARINRRDLDRLLAIAAIPHHAATNVALRLALAASHPQGPQPFPASLLFSLIYWALRLKDEEFLGLTREVVTTCTTACDSFAHLVSKDDEMPRFNFYEIEQQFLADEYYAQKRKQLL